MRQTACVLWCLPAKVHGAGLCLCGRLEEELRKLREETNVDSLRQELDRERSKRLELEQKMNEVVKSRWESVHAEVSAWESSEYYPNRSVTPSEVNRAPLVCRSAHWRGSFRTKEHPQSARKFLLTEEMMITLMIMTVHGDVRRKIVIPRCDFTVLDFYHHDCSVVMQNTDPEETTQHLNDVCICTSAPYQMLL